MPAESPAEPMLSIRGLHKHHGSQAILKGIDLEVPTGQVLALIGPSGAGKSTLIRCINRLEDFERGEIRVAGRPMLRGSGLSALRADIGMVFQGFHLFPHLSAWRNVALAPHRVRGIPRAAAESLARQCLAEVGVGELADKRPAELSGGQQQRVAIARALAMGPKLLLFDEPTSALDPESVGEVLAVIQQLAARGSTMLIVTHEMAFARRVADRVIFMEQGMLVEQGSPAELFDTPRELRTASFLRAILPH